MILTGIFYSLTTPVGIAAGIGIHQAASNPDDNNGYNVATGILDAVSGGILIYIGLANLIPMWLSQNAALLRSSWEVPVLAYSALALGMAAMAVVGIWA